MEPQSRDTLSPASGLNSRPLPGGGLELSWAVVGTGVGETAEQNNKEPKNALALKRHAWQAHEARPQQLQAKAKTQRAASGAAQHSPTHSFIHSLIHSRSHSSAPPCELVLHRILAGQGTVCNQLLGLGPGCACFFL